MQEIEKVQEAGPSDCECSVGNGQKTLNREIEEKRTFREQGRSRKPSERQSRAQEAAVDKVPERGRGSSREWAARRGGTGVLGCQEEGSRNKTEGRKNKISDVNFQSGVSGLLGPRWRPAVFQRGSSAPRLLSQASESGTRRGPPSSLGARAPGAVPSPDAKCSPGCGLTSQQVLLTRRIRTLAPQICTHLFFYQKTTAGCTPVKTWE